MTTTLITGANKGLGYETARRLIALGHTVYLGARDRARGEAAAEKLGATFVQIDVTDDASVTAAAAFVQEHAGTLDVLINNAGIAGPMLPPAEVSADDVRTVYETNVFSIVRVTRAMLPLLERSASPVIVNVSSGLGSMTHVLDSDRIESKVPGLAYCSAKAAVNMLTVQYAKALPQMRINTVDPGYTATDLNQNRGTQTVEEGTDAIVAMATLGKEGPTASFRDRLGIAPW